MSWNDSNGNDQDPWKNKGNNQGPPDLDEVVRRMQEKLSSIFGGGGKGKGKGSGNAGNGGTFLVVSIILLGLLAWEMVYRIDPAERGVVMRFGQYISVLQPGPHIRFPRPIEQVVKVNVERIQTLTSDSAMLTGDENIVDVEVAIQYRIKDVKNYLFAIADPDVSVRRVTESAIRDIIGGSTLSFVITEGRAEIATNAQILIQEILDNYSSGIDVTSVNMQPAKPPEQVKASFDDAIKAREDEQRKINEAEAYRNEVVERSAGEAARIRLDAEGYQKSVISQAEGEASRFSQLYTEYEKAPVVTRNRLYLDAMEQVMSSSSKVVMDNEGSSNLMYLPLDKLLEQTNKKARDVDSIDPGVYQPATEESTRQRRAPRINR
ncbi:MAG: FtsH protease activity modulator HflK [Gammaproteobacteria bacterium]|jgi:membrane protease subunit HflK